MKISTLNKFNHTDNSTGFTLIELLVSISIMGIVFTLVGTGITLMVSSDQKLAAAQSRRVEVSHALDVISYDIRKAENAAISADSSMPTLPTDFIPVLFLKISIVCSDNTIVPERVIYSTKEKSDRDGRVGSNILYRYGRIADENDSISCSSSNVPVNVPIADNIITPSTARIPTCRFPTTPSGRGEGSGANGFYPCVSDNQVSIALFAKLTNPLIYGDNRTITSGSIPSIATGASSSTGSTTTAATPVDYCTVPDLLTTPKTPSQANTTILTESLSYAGIATTGSPNVVSQTPSAGSKIPCQKGLVTYTY